MATFHFHLTRNLKMAITHQENELNIYLLFYEASKKDIFDEFLVLIWSELIRKVYLFSVVHFIWLHTHALYIYKYSEISILPFGTLIKSGGFSDITSIYQLRLALKRKKQNDTEYGSKQYHSYSIMQIHRLVDNYYDLRFLSRKATENDKRRKIRGKYLITRQYFLPYFHCK